jgi:hypothetical protein
MAVLRIKERQRPQVRQLKRVSMRDPDPVNGNMKPVSNCLPDRIRRSLRHINRIDRLYREEGLTVRKRQARRRAVGSRAPILVESKPNLVGRWISSMTSLPAADDCAS